MSAFWSAVARGKKGHDTAFARLGHENFILADSVAAQSGVAAPVPSLPPHSITLHAYALSIIHEGAFAVDFGQRFMQHSSDYGPE